MNNDTFIKKVKQFQTLEKEDEVKEISKEKIEEQVMRKSQGKIKSSNQIWVKNIKNIKIIIKIKGPV